MNRSSNLGKFGVPSPVIGSQPCTAEKPLVKQPGFEPLVTSWKISGCIYNTGFIKPTDFLPCVARFSLIREIMDAQIGVDNDVPQIGCKVLLS